MNRRDVLRGAVALSVSAPATIGMVAYDPLLDALRAYREGSEKFNVLAQAAPGRNWNDLQAKTYGPALDLLQKWEEPAMSRDGAIEALKMALDEDGLAGMEAADRMIKAVFGYLESLPA